MTYGHCRITVSSGRAALCADVIGGDSGIFLPAIRIPAGSGTGTVRICLFPSQTARRASLNTLLGRLVDHTLRRPRRQLWRLAGTRCKDTVE